MVIGLLVCVLLFTGASCFGGASTPAPKALTLQIWRSEDTQDSYQAAMDAYRAQFPHVGFEYRTFKTEEYEQALIDAWARGEGPDIFSIPNTKIGKFKQFIAPMPKTGSFARATQKKSFGRTVVSVDVIDTNFVSATQLADKFAGVVPTDVVIENQIYGLPLSVDTLALYVNRERLAKAQIALPPTTWEEFRDAVQAMTTLDQQKNIIQAAAPIGTTNNVPYFFDLVSVIMMQNGAVMTTPSGQPAFAADLADGRKPALETLDFYSKFTDNRFKTYTWNETQPNGLEAFTAGTASMYFGYQADRAVIEKRAANLNFTTVSLPQIDLGNPVNFAHYNVETVHNTSVNKEHAWNFLQFFALSQENAKTYSTVTGRPPALLALIGGLQQDEKLGLFARQALTARSWYHGNDIDAAVLAFKELVDEMNKRTQDIQEVLNLTAAKIGLTTNTQ